jgi:hypothetical protein
MRTRVFCTKEPLEKMCLGNILTSKLEPLDCNIRHPHFASEALLKDSNSLNLIPPLSFEEIMK